MKQISVTALIVGLLYAFAPNHIPCASAVNGGFAEKSLFPDDTEMISVMSGPFQVPANPVNLNRNDLKSSIIDPTEACHQSKLAPFSSRLVDELYTFFIGKQVLLAVEGSKSFSFPNDIADNKYEGSNV